MTERQLATRLAALDACSVSDAVDRYGGDAGFAVGGFGTATTSRRIHGRVVTVLLGEVGPDAPTRHLATAAIQAAQVGEVLVVAHSGRTHCAGWGGTLSYAAQAAGIAGTIVDGAIRDVDQARELGYSVFARAATPRTARGRVQEQDWGCTVEVAGSPVSRGDYVVADMSGVVFIRHDALEAVISGAELVTAAEAEMLARLRAGTPITEVMGARYEEQVAGR